MIAELIRDLFRWTFLRVVDAVEKRKQIKETHLNDPERLQTGKNLMLSAGDTLKLGEFAGSKHRETEHRITSVGEVQYLYVYEVPESAHDEIRQLPDLQ